MVKSVGKAHEKEFGVTLTENELIKQLSKNGEKKDFLSNELVFVIEETKIGELYAFYDLGLSGDRDLYDFLDMILKGEFGKLWE